MLLQQRLERLVIQIMLLPLGYGVAAELRAKLHLRVKLKNAFYTVSNLRAGGAGRVSVAVAAAAAAEGPTASANI